jgi:N-acetylglucosamine PTS system EIICBA or EIICB component
MKTWSLIQERLQGLGRALMLPIAVLPVAGLMLRLGQPDLLGLPFIASAGQAIFAHLGLLFAIGVGVGLAKENNGAAGLAGAVAYVVLTEGAKVLMHMPEGALPKGTFDQATHDALVGLWKDKELAKLSVPAGILSGLAAGALYNRFHDIRFPEYLSFFGGRRFVPIISGLFGLVAAVAFGLGFPALEAAVDQLSYWVANAGSVGLFFYGLLNRLLIVTGLHHILNNIVWFVLGDYHGTTGDLNRFFAGDPNAGAFMTGFFPVMMFGLPAACLAMWRAARPERRKAVGGMLFSMALTSFLTGVTEPIEFTFMFLAPALYLLHAVLTGLSMALMDLLGAKIGFGFSAGLFDYLLNLPLSTRAWMLLPVGLAYGAIYYAVFTFAIRRFNLATPGREAEDTVSDAAEIQTADTLPAAYLAALGGPENLVDIGACTTRLRLTMVNRTLVSVAGLKAIGAKAVLEIGERGLQVVIGPDSDRIANAMRALSNAPLQTTAPKPDVSGQDETEATINPALIEVFGGVANITQAFRKGARTIIEVRDPAHVDMKHANAPKPDHILQTRQGRFHVIDAA